MPNRTVARKSPSVRHAFQAPFSDTRRAEGDCYERRAPCPPERPNSAPHPPAKERPAKTEQPPKIPWHLKPLPGDWSAEEQQFFANWMRELAGLNDTLMSAASDRITLLRRARKIYFKLAWKVDEQVREVRTAKPNSVEGDRQ